MLDGRSNDVLLGGVVGSDRTENRLLVRLSLDPQQHDFLQVAVKQRGRFAPRGLQPLLGYLAFLMNAGRISRHLKQRSNEGFEYNRRYRRCSVVIKVETRHFTYQFNS